MIRRRQEAHRCRARPRPSQPPEPRCAQPASGDCAQADPEDPGIEQPAAAGQAARARPAPWCRCRSRRPLARPVAGPRGTGKPARTSSPRPSAASTISAAAATMGNRSGQVLEVAQLPRRLADQRLAKGRPRNDLGKRLQEQEAPAQRARLPGKVGQGHDQEPAQPAELQYRQQQDEPGGMAMQPAAANPGDRGRTPGVSKSPAWSQGWPDGPGGELLLADPLPLALGRRLRWQPPGSARTGGGRRSPPVHLQVWFRHSCPYHRSSGHTSECWWPA